MMHNDLDSEFPAIGTEYYYDIKLMSPAREYLWADITSNSVKWQIWSRALDSAARPSHPPPKTGLRVFGGVVYPPGLAQGV